MSITAAELRPPEHFGLPAGYRQQAAMVTRDDAGSASALAYWSADRINAAAKWQHHVYAWAARICRDRKVRSVLDIGCGPGVKLARHLGPRCRDIMGVDQRSAIEIASRVCPAADLREIDLERPEPRTLARTFDLVLCVDVLEHLGDPDPALAFIQGVCHQESLVLLSTPDRERLRGRGCMESPKPEHVREWTDREFRGYVESRMFEVEHLALLPGDDAPMLRGINEELGFRRGTRMTSPHRCIAMLCRTRRLETR